MRASKSLALAPLLLSFALIPSVVVSGQAKAQQVGQGGCSTFNNWCGTGAIVNGKWRPTVPTAVQFEFLDLLVDVGLHLGPAADAAGLLASAMWILEQFLQNPAESRVSTMRYLE